MNKKQKEVLYGFLTGYFFSDSITAFKHSYSHWNYCNYNIVNYIAY